MSKPNEKALRAKLRETTRRLRRAEQREAALNRLLFALADKLQ